MIDGITSELNDLFDAIKKADNAKIKALLQKPEIIANIAASDEISANAALRIAQENEDDNLVRELLKFEAVEEQAARDTIKELSQVPSNIDNAAALNNNLLRYAAKKGLDEQVEQLLAIPAVAERAATFDCLGQTNAALYHAAANGHTNIVRRLLTNNHVVEQLNASDFQGENAIVRVAARNGHADVIEALLNMPSQTNANHYTAFVQALSHNHLEIAYRLLMIEAVKQHLTEIVQTPINLGIMVNLFVNALDEIIRRTPLDKMQAFDIQVQSQKLNSHLINELINLANECGANVKPHLNQKQRAVLDKCVELHSLSDLELRLVIARGEDMDAVITAESQVNLLSFNFASLSLSATPVSFATLPDDNPEATTTNRHGSLVL